MKRRFVRNLFSDFPSLVESKVKRLVVRDRPDPSRWTKGQAETEEKVEKRAEWELMGISIETFRRRKEGKKTRERDFGLSKNHCTQWRHLETRDRLDRVKKQFSFPRPTGSDCRWPRLPTAYLGFDKAIPIQSSLNGPTIVLVENERRGLAAAQQEAHLSARKIERDANGSSRTNGRGPDFKACKGDCDCFIGAIMLV